MRKSLNNIKKLIDTVKKSLPPEQDFLTELKRSIERDELRGRRKPSNFYKPSGMSCIRNMYYVRTGAKQDETGNSYISWGICNSGSDTHERIQKAVSRMMKNGFDCEYVDVAEYVKSRNLDYLEVVGKSGVETHLHHKTLFLSFLCDGVIRYKGKYYILEIKTESSSKWYSREGVDPVHYRQATAYSTALGIDEVLFLYINRDVFDMKAYMFNVTDEMKQDFVGLIEECESYVNKLIAPPKPEDISRKTCEFCGYKTQCRKELS